MRCESDKKEGVGVNLFSAENGVSTVSGFAFGRLTVV